MSCHLYFKLTLLYITLAYASHQVEETKSPTAKDEPNMELAYASSKSTSMVPTASHKIVATGWPSTSPMWPSVETASSQSAAGKDSSSWLETAQPFIYADKARSVDYSLLLTINSTVSNILKSHIKPMSVNLSFEYYFSYDKNITAMPGIKIEVDRKQFKYLETNRDQVQPKMWLKFDEKISITNSTQLDNSDWLKFSLVNRQFPSLVAIRKLKVEFIMSESQKTTTNLTQPTKAPPEQTSTQPNGKLQQAPAPPAIEPRPQKVPPQENIRDGPTQPTYSPPPATAPSPTTYRPPTRPPAQTTYQPQSIPTDQVDVEDYSTEQPEVDLQPTAASSINGKIKPVAAKKSGWWGKRRKREASNTPEQPATSLPDSIVLTCYQSDRCDWKAESSESIQWSLARQPPSTNKVQSGYYYVSNKNNYGDPSKMLRLTLNQTDSATVADQHSDHCFELAVYVTEKAYLKLYRLTKSSDQDDVKNEENWQKGTLLMIWAPTITTTKEKGHNSTFSRVSMPNAKLTAMEGGKNGWTEETLCLGDFFADQKECASKCAFGFEMQADVVRPNQKAQEAAGTSENTAQDLADVSNEQVEQVVGVSVLREHAVNAHLKSTQLEWFKTWQREEVKPEDNWKFYPSFDYQINPNNVSFVNLFDDAHYYIESDWVNYNDNLEFTATLNIELDTNGVNASLVEAKFSQITDSVNNPQVVEGITSSIFDLKLVTKLVNSKFDSIYTNSSTISWSLSDNSTHQRVLDIAVTEKLSGQLKKGDLFKMVIELVLDCHTLDQASAFYNFARENNMSYKLSMSNVSLSDRCFPSPCQFGSCNQTAPGHEDWICDCDEKHQGRKCEFGRWCKISHVTPWVPTTAKVVLKPNIVSARQPKLAADSGTRVTGEEFCKRKLGNGFNCTNVDMPLNEDLYTDEGKTFFCTCKNDFYLSDDSKCREAHLCSSVVCPSSIGMFCDENKPFNKTQPCHCNEKQDWYPDPADPANKCIRRQCHDKQRDCGFDAHICLPTVPGEKPICKCGPRFALKTDEKGVKYCKSMACVLPTLNDCEQLCSPDHKNLNHPYTCSCHPGYTLDSDGRSCRPNEPQGPKCQPACQANQICTDLGCKCKPGFISEGEKIIQIAKKSKNQFGSETVINYVKSVRCLNVCSLTYAENKEEFEMIESVCPLGLCDSTSFQCKCSDPTSTALIQSKYEPIYSNTTESGEEEVERISPFCRLRRVCDVNSSSYLFCKSQGAICVPDYEKPSMFECICPPSTDKRLKVQAGVGEFTCEPKCNAKKKECISKQAVCRLVDKDQVECDCLPGFMLDQQHHKCYLAKYSYSFNIIVVNRYYEPEFRLHKIEYLNNTEQATKLFEFKNNISDKDEAHEHEILPQYQTSETTAKPATVRSVFNTDYNQCNITQVIPKSVIEDPYEHDIGSFLSYIDQCNERILQNSKSYHLNSRLSEDLRQALRQHLRDFTVTTNNSSCVELDQTGSYLNCTVYLQSNEPVDLVTVEHVFNSCDKNGESEKHCWIKPRLLLKKPTTSNVLQVGANFNQTKSTRIQVNFTQIIPCEIDNFCGHYAKSFKKDDKTSLCSCKCNHDLEVSDVKDLEPKTHEGDHSIKEVCYPKNYCLFEPNFCSFKINSVCEYNEKTGSSCVCRYSNEDLEGRCIEQESGNLHVALVIVVIVLAIALFISLAINIEASARSKRLFGRSKQYPLNDFTASRTNNRSTGVPNPVFTND